MRVFVDTNIWISLFLGFERLSEIIEDCYFQHTLLTSNGIIRELESVLTKKMNYTTSEIHPAIGFVRQRAEAVEEEKSFKIDVCRDPADNHVLSAAQNGNADCILTGDDDWLSLKRFNKVTILSPREFRDWI